MKSNWNHALKHVPLSTTQHRVWHVVRGLKQNKIKTKVIAVITEKLILRLIGFTLSLAVTGDFIINLWQCCLI